MWKIGKSSAQATAKRVIASAARLIEVRHCCRNSRRMAEISVPAWPMPIHQTKLMMMYRGAGIPALQGKLVIADWSAAFRQASGQLFVATPQAQSDTLWPMEKALQLESRIISLAEDRNGEIYVLTHEGMGPFGNTGKVYRLMSAP